MEFTIQKGTLQDVNAYVAMLAEIRSQMDNPEWFYLDPPEDVLHMMQTGMMELWVVLDGVQMAAGFDIIRPGLASCNYGYALDYSQEDLLRVVNMDTAAVRPEYRGQGLQRKLIQTVEAQLRQEGNPILLCTVHPDNCYSLQNVLRTGYTIQKKLPMYGSQRYILRKDL